MNNERRSWYYIMLFGLFFLFDRLSKWWAVSALRDEPAVISDYLNLSLMWNRGVSWSLFSYDSLIGFSILTGFILLVIVLFMVFVFVQYKNYHNISFEVLVLAGALSNVVDRFWYGAVVDFLQFHVNAWYWPTFNVADMCVVVGVVGMLIKNLCDAYVFKNKKTMF